MASRRASDTRENRSQLLSSFLQTVAKPVGALSQRCAAQSSPLSYLGVLTHVAIQNYIERVIGMVDMSISRGVQTDVFIDTGVFVHQDEKPTTKSALLAYHRNRMVSKLALSRYTHILWLDDDLWFPPDVLTQLLSYASGGIAMPLLIGQDGSPDSTIDPCGVIPASAESVDSVVHRCATSDELRRLGHGDGPRMMSTVAHMVLIPTSLYASGAMHAGHAVSNEFVSVIQFARALRMQAVVLPFVRVTHVNVVRHGLIFPDNHLDNKTFEGGHTEMSVFIPASFSHTKTLTRTMFNMLQMGGSPGRINHNAFFYFRQHTFADARRFDRTETVNPSASWGIIVHRMWIKMARIRNSMVAHIALEGVDFVWWLDFDIVSYPLDFSQKAVSLGAKTISCPTVLIEGTFQFYDTCGFVSEGRSRVTESVRRSWSGCDCTMVSREGPPTCLASDGSPVIRPGDGLHVNNIPVAGSPSYVDNVPATMVPMDGCGATYIMPAAILRDGATYAYDPMFTDHFAVMRWAREHGYRILWHRASVAYHADVDLFGPMQTKEGRTASNT